VGNVGKLRNVEVEPIQDLTIFGNPDRQGRCLYAAYQALMSLLRDGEALEVPIERYFSLPLTAGKYSYEFAYGIALELGSCPDRGDFLRKISEDGLEKVLTFCREEKPIDYLGALSEAAGNRWNGPTGTTSHLVWIYNPKHLPLSELLFTPEDIRIAFDQIVVSGHHILIPIYCSVTEDIVSGCKGCGNQLSLASQKSE
jgi:hypothetical protein